MKRRVEFFLLTIVFVLAGALSARAQEKFVITVKGAELTNGVVLVDVVKGAKTFELQCNQGAPNCIQLKSGKYQMLELPVNRGMYDCHDVQVFAETAANLETEQKIGEYCLNEK